MPERSSEIDCAITFHLEEYKDRRREIAEFIKETRSLERIVVVATGAVWAWLVANGSGIPIVSFWIPVLFVVAGGTRSYTIWKEMVRAADYVILLEKEFSKLPNLSGWQTWLTSQESTGILGSAKVYWITLLLMSLLIPFFFLCP